MPAFDQIPLTGHLEPTIAFASLHSAWKTHIRRLIVLLALGGCAGVQYHAAESVPADRSFRKVDFRFERHGEGYVTLPVYFKILEKDGKAAVCGYYVEDGMTSAERRNRRAAFADSGSEFYLDGRYVSSASFVTAVDGNARQPQVGCYLTDVAWKRGMDQAPFRVRTPAMR